MNQFKYIFGHCIATGWQTVNSAFRIWCDLMTDNFENYALFKNDDPFRECYDWFWATLGEDDVLPKEYLEYLLKIVQDIHEGKIELIPMDEDFFDKLKELVQAEDDGDV